MQIHIITMFPEFFDAPLQTSLVGKAIDRDLLDVQVVDLREFGTGAHRQLDDAPFGGGAGMVLMAEPLRAAMRPLAGTRRVLLSPAGKPLDQEMLDSWSGLEALTLVCGRYEGVDQRAIDSDIDEEVSLGDYVLLGGEVGALAIIEGVVRLIPGVVGNPISTETESFRDGLLEEPQYTRPADLDGDVVPEVLLSGHHAEIAEWRHEQRKQRTKERRPDLWDEYTDSPSEP
ncbi:MAG: tRNA (guanosine(37)-N1)-methyltransferase TrmD [Acidimicrobiia bacterium]|nr:tRNA (guanosine(37)-N1)-methyltransferase TrmD [Acidimicrobiia bacterium]